MKPSRAYNAPSLPHTWALTNEYPVTDLRAHLLPSFHGDRSKQLVPRQQSPSCRSPAVELSTKKVYTHPNYALNGNHLRSATRGRDRFLIRTYQVTWPRLESTYLNSLFLFLLHSPQFFLSKTALQARSSLRSETDHARIFYIGIVFGTISPPTVEGEPKKTDHGPRLALTLTLPAKRIWRQTSRRHMLRYG